MRWCHIACSRSKRPSEQLQNQSFISVCHASITTQMITEAGRNVCEELMIAALWPANVLYFTRSIRGISMAQWLAWLPHSHKGLSSAEAFLGGLYVHLFPMGAPVPSQRSKVYMVGDRETCKLHTVYVSLIKSRT